MVQGYTQENSGSASGWQASPSMAAASKSVRGEESAGREILFMLFVCFGITACEHKTTPVHPGNILCGNESKSWLYYQEDSVNSFWMYPSIYTFDKYGDFSKIVPKYIERRIGRDVYDHQWELLDDSTLIIAGYKYTIKYISNEMVLLYNRYNGGTMDTLKQATNIDSTLYFKFTSASSKRDDPDIDY